MKIKTKLILGVGVLFLMIALLSVIGAVYINKSKSDTKNILVANYKSLEYSKEMMLSLDKIASDSTQLESFKKNLKLESQNLTEVGEKDAYLSLKSHLEQFLHSNSAETEKLIRSDLVDVMQLNMEAIQRKSDIAIATAENATAWILGLGTLCFLVALTLLFNLPNSIAEPISILTSSIKQIAAKNYNQRIHFQTSGEFADLVDSFNVMAEKLEEYENSNLAKHLTDKKRVETLISKMRDPVIGLDEENKIIFINDEALKISGLQKEEVYGKNINEVAVQNDLVRELLRNRNDDVSKNVPLKIFADNKESYFEQELIPISIKPTGEHTVKNIGNVIFLRNITPFKELDFAKTNFIATISHELKTPISAIKMETSLLKDEKFGKLNEQQKELVQGIEEDAQRLLNITSELLNMSQVETGNINLEITDCKVTELIENAVQNNLTIANNKELELVTNLKTEDGKTVRADFGKLIWVLNNFIANAVKYSFSGEKITIAAENFQGKVRFSVTDTGTGIEPRFHQQIFERYFQIPNESQNGTGLGLAISKNFIEKMGGSIGVESEKGKGSAFWFVV
ncbi:ATP-binding protein [Chryseobacterium koreense]|uniref:ATP-binding protein n=1 Tax=Chryseobacterium koreense TaxID=232216 RepID=UPI0026F12AF3|nr:ATP-binding protein [Chryseobacterium koreense]